MKHNYVTYVVVLVIGIFFLSPSPSFATSWEYFFVVWDGDKYEVTDEIVEKVDQKIGEVTKYSDMDTYSGNFSNAYHEGTDYYAIQGTSTDEAIAVEEANGKYKKAINRGTYDGGMNTFIDLATVIGGIIVFILILSLVMTFFYQSSKK
ncbi:hypothetical protein NC661_15220 [Aquibacillus koreensis]|uniref:Uncharacterized protein n=1 Tax=Aquibacillus koreensis TaxID=279446 RepID=A0A9X3WKE4_9BACI|nr:hypothetical protein [Aquibacillus koreensis]MCT2534415.1 hypothetical protein [Aquibacillus koreensis]MDC3421722.1 hypothetical protein [Aquibacillus koreensis]